jgi:hypothetical protein
MICSLSSTASTGSILCLQILRLSSVVLPPSSRDKLDPSLQHLLVDEVFTALTLLRHQSSLRTSIGQSLPSSTKLPRPCQREALCSGTTCRRTSSMAESPEQYLDLCLHKDVATDTLTPVGMISPPIYGRVLNSMRSTKPL